MQKPYDTIIIGAGIAGSTAAFMLQRAGEDVVLIDRSSIPASGGSGAAGAFVSPKIGKGGPLQQLTNEAFAFAHMFYREHTPEHFTASGVVRIPKNPDDAERFTLYESHNYPVYERWNQEDLAARGIEDALGGFYFPEAGDCDAQAVCRTLASGIDFVQLDVRRLSRAGEVWRIEGADRTLEAARVVLATGYQNELIDMRYMGIRGLWGSRGDYGTSTTLPVSLHKSLSVSSTRQGRVKIGATHVKHTDPCLVCNGQPLADIFDGASELVDTSDFTLLETFCGMRSTSRDHVPVVGEVIDVSRMLQECPAIVRGATAPLQHIANLFVLNGLGGRGFVFAPLMAQWLTARIVSGCPIPDRVHPDRLFYKWARTYLTK